MASSASPARHAASDGGTALIGYTGFVGSNLVHDADFDILFNSRNISDIRGRHFDKIVCAGVSAVKWRANQNPDADWTGIESLIRCLEEVTTDRFVLISTIDVYSSCRGVTERSAIPRDNPQAYGRHRLQLEDFVAGRFPVHHIVRLPALFGPGLKKNAIFDLLHNNNVAAIPAQGRFQWYPVNRLAGHLNLIEESGVSLINVATEPMVMQEIVDRFFPGAVLAESSNPPEYDMHTEHAALLGGTAPYHIRRPALMDELTAFIASERGK